MVIVEYTIQGLSWLRKNAGHGVVYFADDDNTYDIRLFDEVLNKCMLL
jgi:hypothetical protein